ncbi:hypothetical protein PPTG_24012 [Phytophthora nicotianae INRA-310]|uniref:SWIM-type domain-containing protein n=1 Tax=Phytophthora nicotianae (strain INRA-310) TaxID=761204 RepID=W2PP93_PHYN3|nr:hypothetical protein PPTG_24012 [Phytophthora nicotianae INRA-310]ETN01825.1 hypothetical protein PPTG_24012 [Phytophthora nicotianae INRA-310]
MTFVGSKMDFSVGIRTTSSKYEVNISTYACTCFFMRTMLLPCRHTIFARFFMKKKKLIPINYINPRWLLGSDANRPEDDESNDDMSCPGFCIQNSNMNQQNTQF